MFDFFEKVLGFLETIVNFITNLVESLLTAYEVFANSLLLPSEMYVLMPSILGSAVIITIALAVVKFIIGR